MNVWSKASKVTRLKGNERVCIIGNSYWLILKHTFLCFPTCRLEDGIWEFRQMLRGHIIVPVRTQNSKSWGLTIRTHWTFERNMIFVYQTADLAKILIWHLVAQTRLLRKPLGSSPLLNHQFHSWMTRTERWALSSDQHAFNLIFGSSLLNESFWYI